MMQRPYTYISYLSTKEKFLFWISFIGVVGLLGFTLWSILTNKNPGDGSSYLWLIALVFPMVAFNYRLIIKGIEAAGEQRKLTDEEGKYLLTLQNAEKNLREENWKKKSKYVVWLERVYFVLIGFVLLVLLLLFLG